MTPQAALDRIAALCDGFEADGHGDAVSITAVRAVLAEVTPEPGGDMPSPLTRPDDMQSSGPETYRSGGVLDRDALLRVLNGLADEAHYTGERDSWAVHLQPYVDRILALVRPAPAGVTLTPEEADDVEAVLQLGLDVYMDSARGPRLSALAARLEASQ